MARLASIIAAAIAAPLYGHIILGFLPKVLQVSHTYQLIACLAGSVITIALHLASEVLSTLLLKTIKARKTPKCQQQQSSPLKAVK